MLSTKTEKISKIEVLAVSVIAVILLLIPGLFLGVFKSGLHLVDDHEILRLVYEYRNGMKLTDLIKFSVNNDIVNRFRPLYMASKAVLVPIFGDDLAKYEIMKAVESMITFVFVYLIVRKLRPYICNRIVAFAFTLTVFLGYQSCIWWKLGTHEIQGMLLFSIGFFLFQKYLETGKKAFAVSAVILFEIMIFYKENLFLLLPFVGFYTLYLDLGEERISFKALWAAIKKRLVVYIFLLVLVAETLYGCLVIINPMDYKHGTYTLKTSLFDADLWNEAFHSDLKWYSLFGLLMIMLLLTFYDEMKKYWKELLLGFLIIAPQVIVYGTTGISERYIVPASFGFAYLFIYLPFATGIFSKWRGRFYILCLLLLTAAHGRVMLREADYYRFRGNGVQDTADFIVEVATEKPDVKIMSALEYFESNQTLQLYSLLRGQNNMYFYHSYYNYWEYKPFIDRKPDMEHSLLGDETFLMPDAVEDMDVIILYSDLDRHFSGVPDIDTSDFTTKRYGTLDILVRNGSGINFPDAEIEPMKINF